MASPPDPHEADPLKCPLPPEPKSWRRRCNRIVNNDRLEASETENDRLRGRLSVEQMERVHAERVASVMRSTSPILRAVSPAPYKLPTVVDGPSIVYVLPLFGFHTILKITMIIS